MEKKLDWMQQRIEWNKEGRCAREACQAKFRRGVKFRNSANGLFYCGYCARQIEEANNGEIKFEEIELDPG